jgi:hypothetical protein
VEIRSLLHVVTKSEQGASRILADFSLAHYLAIDLPIIFRSSFCAPATWLLSYNMRLWDSATVHPQFMLGVAVWNAALVITFGSSVMLHVLRSQDASERVSADKIRSHA